VPVLLETAVDLLACAPGKVVVDATIGGGGHAALILERIGAGGILIGLDRDGEALELARRHLGSRPNVVLIQENFRYLTRVLDELQLPGIDALLLDLGLSSFQVDDPRRGFSFQSEGPLDMRMDHRQEMTAEIVVNTYSEKRLSDILRRYGEETHSRKIARTIASERAKKPITTTAELADIVRKAVPRAKRPSRIHPATRTFQALRIEVNSELDNLAIVLDDGVARLKRGGRICVIAFHSLEDRIVKRKFAGFARGCTCPPELPQCICGKKPTLKIITRKPIIPSPEEIAANPRSRSARLRAAEKTGEDVAQ
jgi:16S rRNA (cytosine1402-N4)-methyltransferase